MNVTVLMKLCKNKGISVAHLEKELGYGNGSLLKRGKCSAKRLYEVSSFFNVSMEYLLTGKESASTSSAELERLKQEVAQLKTFTDMQLAVLYQKAALVSKQFLFDESSTVSNYLHGFRRGVFYGGKIMFTKEEMDLLSSALLSYQENLIGVRKRLYDNDSIIAVSSEISRVTELNTKVCQMLSRKE